MLIVAAFAARRPPQLGSQMVGDLIKVVGGAASAGTAAVKLWPRFRAWRAERRQRASVEARVHLIVDQASVRTRSTDYGELELYLEIVNFWRGPLTLETVEISQFLFNNSVVPRPAAPLLRGRGPIASSGLLRLGWEVRLGAPEIAAIENTALTARNPKSTPVNSIDLWCAFGFSDGKHIHRFERRLEARNPQMHLMHLPQGL